MPTSTSRLSPGNRVTERANPGNHVFREDHPNFSRISRYASSRRAGRVISVQQKRNASGKSITYVNVIWDGLRTPSTHAASRLVRIEE